MSAPVTTTDTVTVVVVDDTPDIRMLLRRGLQRFGPFTVIAEAGDGSEGVDQVRRHQPDLVVLDLAMPVMDGLEALPLIRQASPRSKVVVLSGFESDRMGRSALERGAAAYVQKGVTMTETVRVLCEVAGVQPQPRPPRPQSRTAPDDADEIARMRSALAIAAHELRGPASMLVTAADMLEAELGGAGGDVTFLLDTVRRQAMLLDQVTSDLSVLARSQHGALTIRPTTVEVLPLLQAACATAAAQLDVLVTCPVGLTVYADELRMLQMLGNLISNAVKYAQPPVRLVAQRGNGSVEIRLVDTGPGVEPDFRPRLFERFSRADGRSLGGMGIGLYVVRTLAEAQGGRAWYEPAGAGSAFCVELPAEPPT